MPAAQLPWAQSCTAAAEEGPRLRQGTRSSMPMTASTRDVISAGDRVGTGHFRTYVSESLFTVSLCVWLQVRIYAFRGASLTYDLSDIDRSVRSRSAQFAAEGCTSL